MASAVGPDQRCASAEWLATNKRTSDAAIEIQIANAKLPTRAHQVRGLATKHAAGEFVFRCVRDCERLAEICCGHDCEYGSKDFLASESMISTDAAEDRWSNERLSDLRFESIGNAERQLVRSFLPANLDGGANLLRGLEVDHGTDVGRGRAWIAHNERPCRADKSMQERLVRTANNNCAARMVYSVSRHAANAS